MGKKTSELFSEYVIETWYSKNDKAYMAKIQEIPECITDVKTRIEAINELELVFQGWYEIAVEDGINIPRPKKFAA